MIRYLLALLVFFAGFVLAVLSAGQSFLPLLDLITLLTIGLVPFLFTSVLFGFREMKEAYKTALRKEPDAVRISKSQEILNVFGTAIWVIGMITVITRFIGVMSYLDDTASIGPNTALALLALHYSGILYLAAVLPFTLLLKKKQIAQTKEDDRRAA